MLRIIVLLACIVIGTSASVVEYALFYQAIMPISEVSKEIQFMPDDLRPSVLIADISFDKESHDFVEISQEKYSIDIIFKVAETSHNME